MKAFAGDAILHSEVAIILQNLKEVSFEGRTVLVTGGAGFLGSWICEVLVSQGATVICLDDLSSGSKQNISRLSRSANFQFTGQDITKPFHIGGRIDLVLHLASRASPFEFERFPIEILKANTVGTLNVLEIARQHGAKVLFTSSSEAYGNPSVIPTPESYYGYVNPIGIRGCYDEGKRCGEAYVVAYKRQFDLDIRIARIFNTYGPRMRADGIYGRVVSRFISQALEGKPITVFGGGEQTRSFCYVTDQIEGLLRLAWSEKARGEVLNMGSGEEMTIIDLATMIKRLTGSVSEIMFYPLPEDDPRRRCPDVTKATEILGWRPKVKLEEGLQKTFSWCESSAKMGQI